MKDGTTDPGITEITPMVAVNGTTPAAVAIPPTIVTETVRTRTTMKLSARTATQNQITTPIPPLAITLRHANTATVRIMIISVPVHQRNV